MCRILASKKEEVRSRFKNKVNKSNILKVLHGNSLTDYTNKSESAKFLNDEIKGDQALVKLCGKEKSRLAAKNRRNQENECLTELYSALPVAPRTKFLCKDGNSYIGNFEKSTIIKVAAHALKFFKSLPDYVLSLINNPKDSLSDHTVTSLFSQSYFGLFWCTDTKKVIFVSPGLASLTGLYWCNMVGMPRNGIVFQKNRDLDHVFLRVMMNVLKDRGIFSVNPQRQSLCKEAYVRVSNIIGNKDMTSHSDFLANLPCSLWCSGNFSDNIKFELFQPLSIPVLSSFHQPRYSFVQNDDSFENQEETYNVHKNTQSAFRFSDFKFTSYHNGETLTILHIDGTAERCIGISNDILYEYGLLDLFHLDDVLDVYKKIRKLKNGHGRIQSGTYRLITASYEAPQQYEQYPCCYCCCPGLAPNNGVNIDIAYQNQYCSVNQHKVPSNYYETKPKTKRYRWAHCIFQSVLPSDIKISTISSYRSVINQGEAYSENIVNNLANLSSISDESSDDDSKKKFDYNYRRKNDQNKPTYVYNNLNSAGNSSHNSSYSSLNSLSNQETGQMEMTKSPDEFCTIQVTFSFAHYTEDNANNCCQSYPVVNRNGKSEIVRKVSYMQV